MKIKLHFGCGSVYLKGWVNVDIKGKLARNHPDLVRANQTTIEHYFKRPFIKSLCGRSVPCVVDVLMDIRDVPPYKFVDEILAVNVINHLRLKDFLKALKVWNNALKKGGTLIIDVDDIKEYAKMLVKARKIEEIEWALKLIHCHSKTKGDTHYWNYTPGYLKHLLRQSGYKIIWTKRNYIKHIEPHFQVCAKKV